jgi:hypothetical protein
MPIALVAIMVAGIAALAYKKKGPPVAVVQTTPYNGGIGITGGFAPPPVQAPGPNAVPIASTTQSNIPNASQSGVPSSSSHTQEFNTSPAQWSPGGIVRPPYYNEGAIEPTFTSAAKTSRVRSSSGGSCGCGGNCGNPSTCSIAQSRNRDGGCLAPTREAQLSRSSGVIAAWAANVQSNGASSWETMQQTVFDMQQNIGSEENYAPPAASILTGVGLNYRRTHRSSVQN